MTFAPSSTFGNTYLTTTRDFDQDDVNLRILLNQMYVEIANALNLKSNGIFEIVETQTGEQFFGSSTDQQKKRFSFRKVFSFGAVAASGTETIAHNINNLSFFTHIYGTCVTDVIDYRPIPYAAITAVTDQIEVKVDSTNIIIDNGSTAPNITSGIIVLEYIKQ